MKPKPGSFESFFGRDAKALFEEYWPDGADAPRHDGDIGDYMKEKYPEQWQAWRTYWRLIDGS